jgi:hypothetical protein
MALYAWVTPTCFILSETLGFIMSSFTVTVSLRLNYFRLGVASSEVFSALSFCPDGNRLRVEGQSPGEGVAMSDLTGSVREGEFTTTLWTRVTLRIAH